MLGGYDAVQGRTSLGTGLLAPISCTEVKGLVEHMGGRKGESFVNMRDRTVKEQMGVVQATKNNMKVWNKVDSW